MVKQLGNDMNVKEVQAQTTDQRRIEELKLVVQHLQYRLRIYEDPKAVNDDVHIVVENDDRDVEVESDGSYIHILRIWEDILEVITSLIISRQICDDSPKR